MLGLVNTPALQLLLFAVFTVNYIMTIVGNLMIITIIQIDSRLHKPMYFFLKNLSFLEIFYTTSITPNSLRIFLDEDNSISFIGCFTQIFLFVALGGTECVLLSVMAYDRFVAICHPLIYSLQINPTHCFHLAVLSWSVGSLNSLVQTIYISSLPFCKDRNINNFFCDIPPVLKLSCVHNKLLESFVHLIGESIVVSSLSLIVISYIWIIRAVLRIPRKSRSKAFSTCGSHLTVVVLFSGTVLFPFLHPSSSSSSVQDKILAVVYSVITPLINPLIYSIRNTDFQVAIKKWIQS